jgi:hypothetical protein
MRGKSLPGARAIPGATVRRLNGTGHVPKIEIPELLAEPIWPFVISYAPLPTCQRLPALYELAWSSKYFCAAAHINKHVLRCCIVAFNKAVAISTRPVAEAPFLKEILPHFIERR